MTITRAHHISNVRWKMYFSYKHNFLPQQVVPNRMQLSGEDFFEMLARCQVSALSPQIHIQLNYYSFTKTDHWTHSFSLDPVSYADAQNRSVHICFLGFESRSNTEGTSWTWNVGWGLARRMFWSNRFIIANNHLIILICCFVVGHLMKTELASRGAAQSHASTGRHAVARVSWLRRSSRARKRWAIAKQWKHSWWVRNGWFEKRSIHLWGERERKMNIRFHID